MDKDKVNNILKTLEKAYGNTGTALNYDNPFELLVATILSAQCTDQRVNKVTPKLFEQYDTPEKLSRASIDEIEKLIKTCGLFRNKAKNLIATSKMLVDKFNGQIPDNMEDLLALPGVGRKTANVVLSNAFSKDAIAVDTHVLRVAKRLGLSEGKDPLKTEQDLMKTLPKDKWSQVHHWIIYHGRNLCDILPPLKLRAS